ncbi:hypothetical protein DLD99_07420 [Pseudomonas kribbensis]|uniref:Phage abortive infection protein n=1 Tax=Pseudomonas kribbensis TaxID=1628086 RepID=A0A345RLY8_9PSED|nr:hypothetical protein [Pseudomonas kribbensis]AXI60304.1 hypothetical protein DLD99_07420 [Pseudomonas kribbensis]
MHYEKKGFNTVSLKAVIQNSVIGILSLIAFVLLLYVHAPLEFWWPIKFIDLINAIAQIATASAFFLAVHQYRKNKESERQKVLIEESRALINRIKSDADAFSKNHDTTAKNSISFMDRVCGHAGNFNAIFKELNEDIHKAIVRMHWQDMYFGELNRAIEHFNNTINLNDFNVLPTTQLRAYQKIHHKKSTGTDPLPIFEKYLTYQLLVDLPEVSFELRVDNDTHIAMHVFEKTFFDNEALKDHLYGCFNIIDVRVRSPLMAVLNERFLIQEIKRNPLSYKTFWYFPDSKDSGVITV